MFTYSDFRTIRVSLDEAKGVAVLTLYRPDAQNSFNQDMVVDLARAFRDFDLDDRVRVVVFTGHGNFFCAGADLRVTNFSTENVKNVEWVPPTLRDHRDGGGIVSLAIHRCRKVVICAINGPAVGVGITMTLGADIRIAHSSAKVGFVFARRGICAEACSSYFLPRLIGHSRTMELLLTARVLPASHPSLALLFSSLYEKREDVLPAAISLAQEIAANCSVISAAVIKSLIWRGGQSAEEAHLLDSKAMFELGNGVDAAEGVASFMQKRPVAFKGSVSKDMPSFWPWYTPIDTTKIGNTATDGHSKIYLSKI